MLALERLTVRWARGLAVVAGGLLLAVALATVGDALLRYGLSRPLSGVFELTELILAAIIFFGLPYTGVLDGHVAVDVLRARFGRRVQHGFVAVGALAVTILLGAITYEMAVRTAEVLRTHRTTITARIPEGPFMVPVTLASGLATVAAAVQALGAAARVVRPDLPPPPTAGS